MKIKMIINLENLNKECQNTLVDALGIKFTRFENDELEAIMPIDCRTMRPGGALHGGSNLALAESIGGALGMLVRDGNMGIYGIEVNGNHIKKAKGKFVRGIGRFIHNGRSTQVVSVEIRDEFDSLVSICRVTNIVSSQT